VGRYNADATVSWNLKDRHAFELTAGRNFFEGWGQADTGEVQRRLIYKPKTQYFGTAAYNYTAPSGFKLSAASDFFKEKITDRGSAYIDPYRAYGLDQKFFVTRSMNRLQLEGAAGKKGYWSLSNSYNIYHRIRESVEKDLETLEETPLKAAGSQDTSRFDELNLRSSYARTVGAFKLDGGYDIGYQTGRSGKLDSTAGETARYTQGDFALYANAGWSFWREKATLQAGLRAAVNTQYKAPLVPALNLLLKPTENVQIRASFAEGFRAPTLKELHLRFIDQNHEIIGNPNLRAERSRNYQLSVSGQKTLAQKVRTRSTLSGYFNDVRDGITLANPTGDPASLKRIYSNLARQQTAIGQLQLQGDYKTLQVVAGGGLTHILGQEGAYEGFTVPEVTGQGSYRWKPIGTTFTAFYKYTGVGRQLSADAEGNALYSGKTASFQQVDVSAQRALWKDRISLTAGVKNLLNIQTLATAGAVAAGGHTAAGALAPLPRRVFVQLAVGLVR
jgi:outer membrane receptor for ferrienterochelin and colicins